jgi:tetratricopeptide (TPR) repeat protein
MSVEIMKSYCVTLLLAAICGMLVTAEAGGQNESNPFEEVIGRADRPPASGSDDQRITTELLQELRVAELLEDRGELEKAVVAYRAVYGKLKKILEEDHRLLLHILDGVTDIRVTQGKPEEAEGPLAKVVALRDRRLADTTDPAETARLAADLIKLGRIHGMTGKPEEAFEPLERGRALLEKLLGNTHEIVLESDRLVAEAAWDVGQFSTAAERLGVVLEAATAGAGEESALAAAIRDQAAVIALIRELPGEAIAAWSEAAGTGSSLAKDESVDRLRWLAVATACDGDLEEATMIWLRCLRSAEVRIGEEPIDAACDAALLGVVLELAGRRDEAEPLFRRFTTAVTSSAQVPAPHRCEQLRKVVPLLLDEGHIDRAAALMQSVLACDERRPSGSLVEITDDKVLIASCLYAGGDLTAAEALLKQSLSGYQRLLGNAHYKTVDALVLLGRSAAARGDAAAAADAADALVRRAPPVMNPRREAEMAELVATAAALVENTGNAERGVAMRDRWIILRGGDAGGDSPAVADILVSYANAMVELGDSAKAVPLYEKARAMRESLWGNDHPAVAAVLLPLCRGYEAVGRIAEARQAAKQGLAIWELAMGSDHAVTLEAVRTLASAHDAAGDPRAAGPLYERLLAECERRKGPRHAEVGILLTKIAEARAALGDVAAAEKMLKRAIDIQALASADPSAAGLGDSVSHLKQMLTSSASLEKARELAMRSESADSASELLASLGTGRPAGDSMGAVDQRLATGGRQSGGAEDAGTAADLIEIARRMERNGNRNAARAALEQALTDARRKHGEGHPRIADILVAIGDLFRNSGEFDVAFANYQKALEIRVASDGEADINTVLVALKLAAPLQVSRGGEAARSILSLASSRLPSTADPAMAARIAAGLRDAADYTMAVADYSMAVALLEKLAAMEAISGQPAAQTYEDLAQAYELGGLASRAVPLRQKLLDSERGAASAVGVGRRLVDLALAQVRANKAADAEPLLRQAVTEDEKLVGKSHPLLASDLLELATAMEAAKKNQADVAAFVSAAQEMTAAAVSAASAKDTAAMRILAESLRRRGDLATAGSVIQVALTADMKERGRGHRDTARDHRELAVIRRLEGDMERAAKNYERLVSILTANHGPGDHRTVAARFELEDMLENGNRSLGKDGLMLAVENRGSAAPSPGKKANAFTDILADYAAARSKPAAEAADAGALAASDSSTAVAAGADKARRMIGVVKDLYGSDGIKKKKGGGLEGMINYAEMLSTAASAEDSSTLDVILKKGMATLGPEPSALTAKGADNAQPSPAGVIPLPNGTSSLASARRTLPTVGGPDPRSVAGVDVESGLSTAVSQLLADAWRLHVAGDDGASDGAFRSALARADEENQGSAASPQAIEVLSQFATALVERGDMSQARTRIDDLRGRQAVVLASGAPGREAADMLLLDVLLALGDTRAAWPFAMAGLRSPPNDPLAAGQAAVRAAIVEAAAGRMLLAWSRLDGAREVLVAGFRGIESRATGAAADEDSPAGDRRLFRLALEYAEVAFACGDPARAAAAIRKTMATEPVVASATAADLDQALSLWTRAAIAAEDLSAARQSLSRLRKARENSFGPADIRVVTAAACLVAVEHRAATASAAKGNEPLPSRDTLREVARQWLEAPAPKTCYELGHGVADLVPIFADAIAAEGGDEAAAADRELAAAVRSRTLLLVKSLQAEGHRSILRLAAAEAAADPGPEAAARVVSERSLEGPLVRRLAGREATDIRSLQAAMLEAVGEEGWSASLKEDAARSTVALAARRKALFQQEATVRPSVRPRFPFRAAPKRDKPQPAAG